MLGVAVTGVDEPAVDALVDLADAVVEVAVTESGDRRLSYRVTAARRGVDQSEAPGGDG